MAIAGGKLYATGDNSTGQLGLGDTDNRTSFTEVPLSSTITFDANGGTGTMADQVYDCGAYAEALTANAFTRNGYEFAGWATEANGAKVYDDQEVTYAKTLGTSIKLYALWTLNAPTVEITTNASEAAYGETVTLAANVTKYQRITYTYQWYKDENELTGKTEETLTLTELSDSGSYTVKVTATNGVETKSSTSAAQSVTINRASLNLSVTLEGWTYGETAAVPVIAGNTGNGTVAYAYKGTANDGTAYESADAPIKAGNYTLTATVGETANYLSGSASTEFVIAPREIAVKIDDKSSVYGEAQKELTYTITSGEIVAGDELNVKLAKAAGDNAGTYAITGEWNNDPNYNVTFTDGVYEITKATYDMSGAQWKYREAYTYDGTEKSVSVTDLPAGVTVRAYTNNVKTNAGIYTASVTFDYDTINYNAPVLANLNWAIEKAVYDISGITFEGATVTYNGEAHRLAAGGTLPAGVTVTYVNNDKTNVGVYTVTAKFTGDADNYELIPNKTATLTINKAVYDMSGVTFGDKTVTYNGQAHSIEAADLPAGVTVTYENNGKTNAGTYEITATFAGDTANYEPITETLTATLTINKAVYDMSGVTFEGVTVTYDGEAHSLAVGGTLPAGVTVTYENNGKTDAGEYTVTAKFTGDADNYEPIPDMTAKLTIEEAAEKGGCSGCGGVIDGATLAGAALASLAFGLAFAVRKFRKKNR